MRSIFKLVAGLIMLQFLTASCAWIRESKPILPISEYERMIVGRFDAEYVGTDNCVSKCHFHDRITDEFKHSVHGEQIRHDSRLPLVNCESCHGPGSLAIAKIGDDTEFNDSRKIKCDATTFLDIMNLPPKAQSLICLKCHSTASIPILSHWNTSAHAVNDVSCFDCHKLHQGSKQKVSREEMSELCYKCHPEVKIQNRLFSHHPIVEKKMSCVDCHNPHGSIQENLLVGMTPRDTCTRCHMEKQGPFVFEHGDVTEDCSNCHSPHGSVNRNLLDAAMPFLCLQCHSGHTLSNSEGVRELFVNRCTDCHSQPHGTDIPVSGRTGNGTLRQ